MNSCENTATVSIAEIAECLRHLRRLSRPADPGSHSTTDPAAERAVFLDRKAEMVARIAAQHPDLIPPSPTHSDPTDSDPT
jgi:hypothetical protein